GPRRDAARPLHRRVVRIARRDAPRGHADERRGRGLRGRRQGRDVPRGGSAARRERLDYDARAGHLMRKQDLQRLDDVLWEIPRSYRDDMRVPGRVYTTERMLDQIVRDRSLEQLVNVATLPGIRKYAIAMPDVHEGYGFPIGGVAAVDAGDGVISPGGIGYDINCGVRLLRTRKSLADVKDSLRKLAHSIAR